MHNFEPMFRVALATVTTVGVYVNRWKQLQRRTACLAVIRAVLAQPEASDRRCDDEPTRREVRHRQLRGAGAESSFQKP
jgi:hypothetical protein